MFHFEYESELDFRKWARQLIILIWAIVGLSTVVEGLIALSVLSGAGIPGRIEITIDHIRAYLVMPFVLTAIVAGVTTLLTVFLVHREKYAVQAYLYLTSMCVLCTIIVCVHYNLLATEAVFCLPIILSLTYVDKKPLRYVTFLSMILYIISVFIIRTIAAGQEDIMPGVPTALTMLAIIFVSYLISDWSLLRQKELMCKLMHIQEVAYTDVLTGLYNRRYFLELATMNFDKSRRLSRPCYAMIFDLDFFKRVNDTYGHPAGDEVLRTVSARTRDIMRSYDNRARYGGEEFVVFLTDISREDALHLAERIRQTIALPACLYEDLEIPITVSIGVAESLPNESLSDLLKRADQALYTAKANGRNQVVYAEPNVSRAVTVTGAS